MMGACLFVGFSVPGILLLLHRWVQKLVVLFLRYFIVYFIEI